MSDEIDERKPSISPRAMAHGGLLSRRAGSSRVHGATDIHREFGRREIIDSLISRAANRIVFCAQVRGAQDPMGFIEDLGLLFVSTQIGVRLKFPHDGAVCALDDGHIGGGMNLQNFVVVDIGGGASSPARLACLCAWKDERTSTATHVAQRERSAQYQHNS